MKKKPSKKHSFLSVNFWLIVLIVAVFGIGLPHEFNRYLAKGDLSLDRTKVSDSWVERTNDWFSVSPPSVEIERLAIATTMTPEAQQLFYRQTPTIEPKETFFKVCEKIVKTSDTLILFGCYSGNRQSGKIAIRSVTDPRFKGVMEVTAAHEMLHAAYTRLSLAEREMLTPQLKEAALRITNERLSKVLKQYEEKDTALFLNELHSYIGTELDDLSNPQLEQYYQRYFRDRNQVVALAEKSQETVRKLDERAKQLKSEINDLEASLNQTQEQLKQRDRNLESQKQNLDKLRADLIDFKEQAQQSYREGNNSADLEYQFEQMQFDYNEKVQEFNDQVRQHQDNAALFKKQVEYYKQKVQDFNEIGNQEREIFAEFKPTSSPFSKDASGNKNQDELQQIIEDSDKLPQIMEDRKE
ncbi:MAG TPA: hypothetical protein DEG17_24280 [Cyanobacteria bacterium UBA11149]|nr:hypothetical protein [Cyanobacteria bacterium UBA11367]HBE57974.1 hypothetical protein [Cyanobacteria bacterium UBA11366]HBK63921.1 hypothetical protein [Cyanobacteria bacterium UBA11166]HBR76447.1 hypothetical protein [Cyanobacteria bacterium UBA11159]HBS68451.1 hypothetical protein [Cyanobacteria bacterium UBA11153]HBW91898.1 hypothetical protein [Cyanobacteria bacterium UBA11149]HCA94547.1 hypothetical protein [Cyanobacteria bacterium UBA9226]